MHAVLPPLKRVRNIKQKRQVMNFRPWSATTDQLIIVLASLPVHHIPMVPLTLTGPCPPAARGRPAEKGCPQLRQGPVLKSGIMIMY